MTERKDDGIERMERGEVDWNWVRYRAADRAIAGTGRPARFALVRATRAELALDGEVSAIGFGRPGWHYALAASMFGPIAAIATAVAIVGDWAGLVAVLGLAAAVRPLLYRIRARWNDDQLVIESWPQRRGRRVARAEVVDIHRRAGALTVRLASGDELPLVAGRRVGNADVIGGRELAYRLGVPFADDTGEVLALPDATIV